MLGKGCSHCLNPVTLGSAMVTLEMPGGGHQCNPWQCLCGSACVVLGIKEGSVHTIPIPCSPMLFLQQKPDFFKGREKIKATCQVKKKYFTFKLKFKIVVETVLFFLKSTCYLVLLNWKHPMSSNLVYPLWKYYGKEWAYSLYNDLGEFQLYFLSKRNQVQIANVYMTLFL